MPGLPPTRLPHASSLGGLAVRQAPCGSRMHAACLQSMSLAREFGQGRTLLKPQQQPYPYSSSSSSSSSAAPAPSPSPASASAARRSCSIMDA